MHASGKRRQQVEFSGSGGRGVRTSSELHRRPQDYLVTSNQPWLDGFVVEKGVIRQFVTMPLGAGYTVEEQPIGAVLGPPLTSWRTRPRCPPRAPGPSDSARPRWR